jgi:glycosyltransferase involved in cell wall biosynthesis
MNLFASMRLARWAREQDVTVIHGHGFKSDAIGLLAARLAGCKMISTPHGWSLEANIKLQIYEKLDRFLLKFTDMVCPLSPDLMEGLEQTVSPKKLRLVLNGVDIDEIQAVPAPEEREKGTFVLGYIGQLIERKDLSTLLRAVKYLVDDHVNLRLMIIGDGPKLNELKEESNKLSISAITDFMGFRNDAIRLLKTFDAFALPSRLEGIPRCIMESMAAGVPVVVSDIPGNRSLVTHGETGLLFPLGESRNLAEQILWLVRNPGFGKIMATQAQDRIKLDYSNRKMAKEYSAIYNEIIRE